ncbi:MAG TPA: hypothetical protein VJP85_09820 [Candidatus Baltobacteraceae bacterium]|nr:hypothetical protein [Candidatus Baltobacteraceae bacterium]
MGALVALAAGVAVAAGKGSVAGKELAPPVEPPPQAAIVSAQVESAKTERRVLNLIPPVVGVQCKRA